MPVYNIMKDALNDAGIVYTETVLRLDNADINKRMVLMSREGGVTYEIHITFDYDGNLLSITSPNLTNKE